MDNKIFRILTSIIPSNYLIDAMKEVRRLASLGERLRKRKNIPLRQPLLNYAFGGTKLFLSDELIELLALSFLKKKKKFRTSSKKRRKTY